MFLQEKMARMTDAKTFGPWQKAREGSPAAAPPAPPGAEKREGVEADDVSAGSLRPSSCGEEAEAALTAACSAMLGYEQPVEEKPIGEDVSDSESDSGD